MAEPGPATVYDLLARTVQRLPTKGALYEKKGGRWTALTFQDFGSAVDHFAAGLLARGVKKGDRVAILAPNGPEWVIADFAALSIGAVSVPIFTTFTPEQAAFVVQDSGARVLVVAPESAWRALAPLAKDMPGLADVVLLATEGKESTFHHVTTAGREFRAAEPGVLTAARAAVGTDDLAVLIYTSGTTGKPKGVMLTHENLVYNAETARRVHNITENDVGLLFLPLAHSFERAGELAGLAAGASGYYAESIEKVPDNLKEVRPTILFAVPRLFEKVRAGVLAKVAAAPARRQKLFAWGLSVGERVLDARDARRAPSPVDAAAHAFAKRVVFKKLHEGMGGRMRFLVSGGAALHVDVARFFWAAGIPVLEGYGLTEAGPVTNTNTLDDWRLRTVGKAFPGTEVRIADDGEVLARGPGIMRGYWHRPDDTKAALDSDGWLHTGDLGAVDADGSLSVTGRKKEIIVKSNGKNVAPGPIEAALVAADVVEQAVLLGDDKPFCAALIVPDTAALRRALGDAVAGLDDAAVAGSTAAREHLDGVVAAVNAKLARFEQVRAFHVVTEPFSVEGGTLTPTLKVKRAAVVARYREAVDALFGAK